ncbi:MAG TPA: HAD family hydrolase [Kofleriaceae bacterium]|nr:HAD family hydrolase [Kofleriaceae bacterium]
MRRYAAVLLDVDGTLVDSNDAHAHCWVEAFAERDLDVSYARVRRMIGMGGDRLIELVAGYPRDSKDSKRLGERRAELFLDKWLPQVKPLDGTRELLLRLRADGYQYAIASAAKAEELTPLLELAGIADLCDRITTSSDVTDSKPAPDTIEAALGRVSVDRHRVVMIGDTPYDVEAARGANVDIIGVTTGGWSQESLAGAIEVYAGPAGLLANWGQATLGQPGGG